MEQKIMYVTHRLDEENTFKPGRIRCFDYVEEVERYFECVKATSPDILAKFDIINQTVVYITWFYNTGSNFPKYADPEEYSSIDEIIAQIKGDKLPTEKMLQDLYDSANELYDVVRETTDFGELWFTLIDGFEDLIYSIEEFADHLGIPIKEDE